MRAAQLNMAHLALVLILAVAAWGIFDPKFSPADIQIQRDQIVHALCVYLLTVFAVPAFPRFKPPVIGLTVFAAAGALEYTQARGMVPGSYKASDLAAAAAGVVVALLPIALLSLKPGGRRR